MALLEDVITFGPTWPPGVSKATWKTNQDGPLHHPQISRMTPMDSENAGSGDPAYKFEGPGRVAPIIVDDAPAYRPLTTG